jgi:predicted LPLAT superfamily acyltransferase
MGSFTSMGLAFFTRINPNLLVPVVIVFLLVSTTSRYCSVTYGRILLLRLHYMMDSFTTHHNHWC